MLALRLARRDLRGGIAGLRILLACLALGVAAIAAVGSLRVGIERGLAANGRALLGGDIEVQGGAQPLPDALRSWLLGRGARISDTVTMRSMLVAPSGARQLVELKAVDDAWPLVGAAGFAPPQTTTAALGQREGQWGVALEQVILDRLGLKPGDTVRLGTLALGVRGVLTAEPDRVSSASLLGARALVAFPVPSLAGLLQLGSLAEFHLRAAFAPGTDIPRVLADLRAAFPNTGWRLRDAADAAPGVVQFIDRTSLFLTLVGLTSLLVGGIGVANGVRAWLEARSRSIATLRCLGASGALVLLVCLTEVMALACFGVLVGVAVGALLPSVAVWVLGDLLPVRPELGLFPRPLALAAFYGVLVAATFALWPLGRAMRIPGGALFRDELLPAHIRPPRLLIAVNVALAAALIALTIGTEEQPGFAAWFCAAAAGTLALFRLGGSALMRLARSVRPPSRAWARLGLANIYRPGAATPLMLVSLGLGLSTLAAVALIEGNVQREITDQMPANAPSFFFVDIQNDQVG
ncbi:MAG: ABC transporter permease, partial [Acetobacteraceae bacterium]|nr:ABC transporter permease [Acetobacteraceae bacterium]